MSDTYRIKAINSSNGEDNSINIMGGGPLTRIEELENSVTSINNNIESLNTTYQSSVTFGDATINMIRVGRVVTLSCSSGKLNFTADTVNFYIPEGYRPAVNIDIPTRIGFGINIGTSGGVVPFTSGEQYLRFAVSYICEETLPS